MTTSRALTPVDWNAVGDEAVEHLRSLLRLDTRNPPGNEKRAADYLRDVLLRRAGITEKVFLSQAYPVERAHAKRITFTLQKSNYTRRMERQ